MPVGNRGWTPAMVAALEAPVLDLEEDYAERLRLPASRHRMVLGLGGIPVAVTTDSDGVATYLQDHFGPFAEATDPAAARVRLVIAECAAGALPFKTLVGSMMTYERGTHAIGKFREMAGYIDTARGEGRGLVAGTNYRQDLGNYLRLVIDAMTPPLDAVLFHTAAIAHQGEAYLFFGPSTAGKSTLSKLSARRHEVMTDDMLVLRLEAGVVRAATCGFWGGETREYPTKRTDLPVRGFFRLRKGAENRLTRLAPVDAAVEVLCGIPNMKRPARDRRFLLDFATAAAERVPFHELAFHKRDDSFWELLDRLERPGGGSHKGDDAS